MRNLSKLTTIALVAGVYSLTCTTITSAYANNSMGVRWSRGTAVRAYNAVVDQTGPAWPVLNAQSQWNQSFAFDANYGCAGSHCFTADEAYYGNNGIFGQTNYRFDAYGYFVEGSVGVHFNDSLGTARDHAITACHELGHALGLDHTSDLSSCMHAPHDSSQATTPNGHDFDMLTGSIYVN